MSFHVPEKFRITAGPMGRESASCRGSNNGLFEWGTLRGRIRVIASDGEGWEHVSVSFQSRAPTWEEMCEIKNLFWDQDDCVVQFHPPKSDYVNFAKFCLHLWRPIGIELPRPPSWMVGPKETT